jgi:hypothetical protein
MNRGRPARSLVILVTWTFRVVMVSLKRENMEREVYFHQY